MHVHGALMEPSLAVTRFALEKHLCGAKMPQEPEYCFPFPGSHVPAQRISLLLLDPVKHNAAGNIRWAVNSVRIIH